MKKIRRKGVFLCSLCLLLAGCGSAAASVGKGEEKPLVFEEKEASCQLLEKPQLSYEVPELTPGLCVASGGYDVEKEKKAYAYGRYVPEEFYLLKRDTMEVVYTGFFSEIRYQQETDSYRAIADFSDFCEAGEYVLRCDYLGYSYPFSLAEGVQERALRELLENYPAQSEKSESLSERVDSALILLLSCELYGGVYKEEIPEALTAVEALARELFADAEDGRLQEGDLYMASAFFAKYGRAYMAFDQNQGNEMVKQAKSLWNRAERLSETDAEYRILAASELYRVTGSSTYRWVVQNYFKEHTQKEEIFEAPYDVLAALTHFTTEFKVNRTLCTTLLGALLERAEEIALYRAEKNGLLEETLQAELLDEIMWNMVYISVVEYVITNYEYGELIEDQYYYLQGRNPLAYDYTAEMFSGHPIWQAAYAMMLCEHLTYEHL